MDDELDLEEEKEGETDFPLPKKVSGKNSSIIPPLDTDEEDPPINDDLLDGDGEVESLDKLIDEEDEEEEGFDDLEEEDW